MENATKAIIIAASVVITLALVTIGFLVLRSGQKGAIDVIDNLNKQQNKMAESEYTIYEREVSGSEVVNALRKFDGDNIGIQVKTNAASAAIWYVNEVDLSAGTLKSSSNDINQTIDETNVNTYINPSGKFKGEIKRDKNGRIVAVIFTQK